MQLSGVMLVVLQPQAFERETQAQHRRLFCRFIVRRFLVMETRRVSSLCKIMQSSFLEVATSPYVYDSLLTFFSLVKVFFEEYYKNYRSHCQTLCP
jgi:hypothetical protein